MLFRTLMPVLAAAPGGAHPHAAGARHLSARPARDYVPGVGRRPGGGTRQPTRSVCNPGGGFGAELRLAGDDGCPPSSGDLLDRPSQEDCQLPLHDDVSQVPPDAQD